MATIIVLEKRKLTAEEVKNKIYKQLETSLEEASAQEARRRAAWQAEEEERRRRMRAEVRDSSDPIHKKTEELKEKTQQELMHIVNYANAVAQEEHARQERELAILKDQVSNDVVREVSRAEVLMAEAQERRRRMTEGSFDPMLSDMHEKVQQEFMSTVSRKEVSKLEEVERTRRIAEDQKIEEREDFQNKVERNFNYLKTLLAEETERNRRVLEEIGDPFSDEILREVSRRQTWLEEEKERARRIFEQEQCEVDSAIERIINHDLVIKLEEEERQRRIEKEAELRKQLHKHKVHPETPEVTPTIAQTMEFPSAVQEEFMSVVSRMVSGRAQEKERDRRILSEEIDTEIRSESNRFLTWVLEERERRRRIFDEMMEDYEDIMQRRVLREQVIALEEHERERRIRAEKTHKAMREHADHPETLSKGDKQTLAAEAQNEKVKEEFMSVVDRKLAREAEEGERERRITEEAILEIRDQEREKITSRLSRIVTKRLEEKERDRRIHEEMETDFQEKIEREMQRRTVIAMEEEERARRIAERTKKAAPAATITVQNK